MEAAKRETSLHAAHAVRQLAVAILDRAVATGQIGANPARSLAREMPRHVRRVVSPTSPSLKPARSRER